MPLPGSSPRQSLDDSHLVFRRRPGPVERSGSCLRFINIDNPSMEDITSESIPIRRHNSSSASRAGDPDDKTFQGLHGPPQTSTKRPNKNAWGVALQSRSHIMPNAEQESSLASKRMADGESLPKKTLHEISSGSSFSRSKGLHSNTKLMRPPFRTSSVPDSEALVHESELLMSRTRCEKNLDCTTFKEKEPNKSFSEASRPTKESKVAHDGQLAGISRTERKFNGGPVLGSPHTKRKVENDVFSPTRTSSFRTATVFSYAGSSLKDYIRSKNTFCGLSDIGEPINGSECRHMQRSMGSHYGGDSSKGSVAFQSRPKHNMPAKSFPQKHLQNSLQSIDSKHFQGGSTGQKLHQIEIQRLHGASTMQRVLPEFKKDADSNHCSSMKPHHLVVFVEGLVRTCGSLLSICLKRTSLFTAPSELITRDNFFVEGSFVIKFRSWITFVFFALWIMSCSCLMLKVLVLKMEITRLYGLLERCASASLDIPSKSLMDEQPGFVFQEIFMNHLSKVALPVILLAVSFLMKKKTLQLQELSRKYIMGSQEDAPIGKRLAYGVDILFSTRPYMKPTALLLATVLLICGGGIALFAVSDDSLSDAMWRAWTYVADSGNHADSKGTWPRIVSLLISFGGMLIFALMLGLISDAISEKVDSLRKGKSEVIESGHTLILGWSDKLGSLLKQLAIANQSLGGDVVVVLAERDKEEMELDIAKLEFDFMGTSVICRSGSPLIMADLKKVSVSKARAIIVLAEIDNADQSDARALRVVLSLTGIKEGLRGHIVVEMRDLDNEALVKLVGGQIVETVVAHDVIGRLMIQCARQPGLAQIWEDILGFEKAEFYIKRWPELDGMCFGDVLISFPDAVPCGVKTQTEEGRIFINPDDDYVLCEGDEILVIAEDDDTYAPAPLPQVRRRILPRVVMPPNVPEKILLCGWRRDIQDMIKVLDAFLAPGSELWIFSDVPEGDREKKLLYGNLNPGNLENIQLVHREGNTVIRRHLESLPLEDFDSILILADEKLEDTVVNADSSSLATLLLIRDIQSKRLPLEVPKGSQNRAQVQSQSSWIREMHEASNKTIIISEILDSRTKHLVSVSKISDYVLSNELVSMALAMVAEDKQINRVLEELFAEEGNELYIRPAEFYLYDQEEVSFFEIMIRARQRDEIVIGYRKALADQAVINPPDKNEIQKWSLQDVFVVLAFEE